jgi:hypothetical protein
MEFSTVLKLYYNVIIYYNNHIKEIIIYNKVKNVVIFNFVIVYKSL